MGGLGGGAAQSDDLVEQIVTHLVDTGGGLHLTGRQFQLKFDAALAGSVRDVGVVG